MHLALMLRVSGHRTGPGNGSLTLKNSWRNGTRRERENVEMPKIALPFLFFFNFGPPIFWGFVGAGIFAPLLWSAGMAIFVILAGWRARGRGLFASVLIGMFFAALVNVPIYFVGRWLAMSA